MSDNRQRVRQVFMQVADMSVAERESVLNDECGGDAALRIEVESLLRAEEQARGFMGSPTAEGDAAVAWDAAAPATVAAAPREQPGQAIGRYQLLQPIGEGGFGSVWMAKQREPVTRRVALKIIKLGMDTSQVIARFEAERQALAVMDHPNIAKVFDAGSTETGRPYFVMEYINGVPIVEYCDTNMLDTSARLELFSSVCHAIQHAHQKGIIHRDIKPTNVLVTMHDGVPVPKVIDFGVAKATNGELTQKTLFTEHRQLVGTPAYMSPEQAETSGLDIDTRSDIYSLGVLLYQLLTGTTPFDSRDLRAAAFSEIQRIIREVDPPKPSTRISALGDTLASTAAQRRTEPRRLGALVRGDLDWIVMKALEKDRKRRYESASALAMDVQRHLTGEPVVAAPPSTSYRLRKFLRRNRPAAILAAVIMSALIVGVAGVVAGFVRAEKARRSESQHRSAAEASAEEAALNAARAHRVSDFLTDMLNSLYVSQSPGNDVKVRPIVDDASKRLDSGQLRDDPEIEAIVRMKLGDAYRCTLQDEYSAEREYASAAAIFERVHGPMHRETLQAMHEVGISLHKQGRYAEAENMTRLILERRSQAFGEDDPDTITSMEKLSWVLSARGNFAEAEPLRLRALELCRKVHGEDHPATITAFEYLGNLYVEQGKIADAEVQYRHALERSQRHYGAQSWQASFTMVDGVAYCLALRGEIDGALEMFDEALLIQRTFGDRHLLARTLSKMGAACTKAGRYEQAEQALTESLEMLREVAAGLDSEAWTLFDFGMLRASQGRLAEAETYMREGLEIRRKLAAAQGKGGDPWSLRALASVLGAQGRQQEANELVREAEAIETHTAVIKK